jgi:deazaflavin-dependent oxidoreductase (nitroreductase family)
MSELTGTGETQGHQRPAVGAALKGYVQAGPTPTPAIPAPGAGGGRRLPLSGSEPSLPRRLIGPILAIARVVNPWVLRLAGRPGMPIAMIHHQGRRSGRPYTTPVIAVPTAGGFIISLPYGSGTDWCRNALAAGATTIRWHGVEHPVTGAEVVGVADALPLIPARLRPVLRLLRLRQFLHLYPASGRP